MNHEAENVRWVEEIGRDVAYCPCGKDLISKTETDAENQLHNHIETENSTGSGEDALMVIADHMCGPRAALSAAVPADTIEKALAELYAVNPREVARVCDEIIDRRGALLGRIRERAASAARTAQEQD